MSKIGDTIKSKLSGKTEIEKSIKSPSEIVKGIDNQIKKSYGFSDILKAASENKDAREKVFSDIVEKLFDKESLLMIARLNQELAYYIVKHLIVEGIYYKYYIKIKVIKKAIPIKKYPFYKITESYIYPDLEDFKLTAYKNLIDNILAITISYGGEGRKEALSVIKSAEAKIMEQEMLEKRGLLGRFLE